MSYEIIRKDYFDDRYQLHQDIEYNKIILGGYLHMGY